MITLHDYVEAEHDLDVSEAKRGWKIHAIVYGVVMTGLIVLNVLVITLTSENFVWFPFPLIGWGIGVAIHYLFAVRWVDRQVREHQTKIERLAERRISA